ncbi:MAG: M48 family metallopeptidase [Candidatus Dadabacteria bacterium]|nr:M48 family metallopeptidase [Candidatus Dadabacteria bacterium]MCZ6685518.1 M48 family metallopeptidase [Candidatus Dadabacteria bacterium]MCZ6864062.1 M48 family metallopeptidase [Candidatus Dadabacteria bacterium]
MSGTSAPKYIIKPFLVLFIFALISLPILSCYKAPVTGRSQFIIITQSQENEMGLTAFKEVLKNEQISTNQSYNNAVTRVGQRIAAVSDTQNYKWEFKVIEDDEQINAFALPGGKVAVYTGILPVAETDAGLATVMAHEVAHVAARHGGERVSTGILAQLGAVGVGAAMGGSDPFVYEAVMQAYGLGANVGVLLPFSRSQESEADRIGLVYMAKAGYDPREAVAFWQRMDEAVKGNPQPPEFLSTHPGYGTRIRNLQQWLPEAMVYYNSSSKAPNNPITN